MDYVEEVCERELDEVDVAQDVDDDRRAGHISEYAESPLELEPRSAVCPRRLYVRKRSTRVS